MNEKEKKLLAAYSDLDYEAFIARLREAVDAAEGDGDFIAEEFERISEEFGVEGALSAEKIKEFLAVDPAERMQDILEVQSKWNMAADQQIILIQHALGNIEKSLQILVDDANMSKALIKDLLLAAKESPASLQRFAAEVLK